MKVRADLVSYSEVEREVVCGNVADIGENAGIQRIPVTRLHGFKGHPFKVENDMALFELMKSIEQEGVLVPAIARPNPYGEGYELIAGHRRKAACVWAGVAEMPVVIKDMTDEQSVIAMVDSNLQREHLKPSEKAFAYKMKLEAIKRQGQRTDLTSCQIGKKSGAENPTAVFHPVEDGFDENGYWEVHNIEIPNQAEADIQRINSNKWLAMQAGESQRQISRFIRLTNLIPKILDMVDEEKISFTVGVEISYLQEEEQYELLAVIDLEECTPSLSQANRMKRMSQSGKLDMDAIYTILEEVKPNQREQIKIHANRLDGYFPDDYTPKQKAELIEKLVKQWYMGQQVEKDMVRNDYNDRAR